MWISLSPTIASGTVAVNRPSAVTVAAPPSMATVEPGDTAPARSTVVRSVTAPPAGRSTWNVTTGTRVVSVPVAGTAGAGGVIPYRETCSIAPSDVGVRPAIGDANVPWPAASNASG